MSKPPTQDVKLPLKPGNSLRSRTLGRFHLPVSDKGANSQQRPKSPKGQTWHRNALDTPMSSVRSIPRPKITWEPGMFTVEYILRNLPLPRVIQCDHSLCDMGRGTMGFDCGELMMMRSKNKILKVKAISMAVDPKDGKTLIETDDRLMVPVDNKGWFAVMGTGMSLQPTPHYRKISNLSQSDCHSFLIGGTDNVTSVQMSGDTYTNGRPLCPGDVLRMGTLDETEKHLHCTDENDREVLIPVTAVGTFYIMQHKTRQIKVPILQIKDILQKHQFPCIVKLVYGREPSGEGVFTKILCLEGVEEEESVLASTLLKSRNTLHELSRTVPNKFKVAVQTKELVQNPGYISGLNLCSDKGDIFMRSIKIFKHGIAESRVTAMGISFASPRSSQDAQSPKTNVTRSVSASPQSQSRRTEQLPQGIKVTEKKPSPVPSKSQHPKPATTRHTQPNPPAPSQDSPVNSKVSTQPRSPTARVMVSDYRDTVEDQSANESNVATMKNEVNKSDKQDVKSELLNGNAGKAAVQSSVSNEKIPTESTQTLSKSDDNSVAKMSENGTTVPQKHAATTNGVPKESQKRNASDKIYVTTMVVSSEQAKSQPKPQVERQHSTDSLEGVSSQRRQRNPDQNLPPPPPPVSNKATPKVVPVETNNNVKTERPPVVVVSLKKPAEVQPVRPGAYEEVWTATSGKDDSDELSSTSSSMSDTFIQTGIGGQIVTGGVAPAPKPVQPEQPVHPVQQVQTVKSVQPVKSVEPVQPSQPETPVQLVQIGDPIQTVQPVQQENTEFEETIKPDAKKKFRNLTEHYSTLDVVEGEPVIRAKNLERSNSGYSTIELDDDDSEDKSESDEFESKRKKRVSFSDVLDVQTYQKQHVTTIDIDERERRRRERDDRRLLQIPRPRVFIPEGDPRHSHSSVDRSRSLDDSRQNHAGIDEQGYMTPVLDRKGRVKMEDPNRSVKERPNPRDVGRRISLPNLAQTETYRREKRRDSESNILW